MNVNAFAREPRAWGQIRPWGPGRFSEIGIEVHSAPVAGGGRRPADVCVQTPRLRAAARSVLAPLNRACTAGVIGRKLRFPALETAMMMVQAMFWKVSVAAMPAGSIGPTASNILSLVQHRLGLEPAQVFSVASERAAGALRSAKSAAVSSSLPSAGVYRSRGLHNAFGTAAATIQPALTI